MKFKNFKQLADLTNRLNRFEEGEVAYVEDVNQSFVYTNHQWTAMKESNVNLTLYDLNKSIMQSMPLADETAINRGEKLINDFISNTNSKYYMLNCKELCYYTILTSTTPTNNSLVFTDFGKATITCIIESLGDILSIDLTEDKTAIEIWFKNSENEIYCMYFFNCENFIVFVGE